MNVGQLKKLIAEMADDTVVLVSAPDHSYRECDLRPIKAAEPSEKKRRGWGESTHYEWYGNKDEYDESVKVVDALLAG